MAHFKRKRPRTRPGNVPHWLNTPSWWNIEFHSRPRRREDQRAAQAVVKGEDPDEMLWALSKKPHRYFW